MENKGEHEMNELDYINVSNRVKISMALTIMRDVLPLEDTAITEKEHSEITIMLRALEIKGFKSYECE